MKPEIEKEWLLNKIRSTFKGENQPLHIDSYNLGFHEINPFIEFVKKFNSWKDIKFEDMKEAPGQVGEIFLRRLTKEGFYYYTPLILWAVVRDSDSEFALAHNELMFTLAPPETQDLPVAATKEEKENFYSHIENFSPEQKNVIADVFDYLSRVHLNWPARQAFEGYWHEFATRQPEIWEPWIK